MRRLIEYHISKVQRPVLQDEQKSKELEEYASKLLQISLSRYRQCLLAGVGMAGWGGWRWEGCS